MIRPQKPSAPLRFPEFITLMALMISLVALSIDAMLPALSVIGDDLAVAARNDVQLVISMLFLGLAVGQLLYGPLSDSIGRKPAIYLGYIMFVVGSIMCVASNSFTLLLAGRVLQGIGAAAPRVVTVALIRDQFEGRAMARVMSFVMAVFIFVPAVAPSLGQGILILGHWRWIFMMMLVLALITSAWFALRQPETLSPERRRPFNLSVLISGAGQTLTNKVAMGYTLVAGIVFGPFLALLNTVQQIFAEQYELRELFPLYFATLALSIGIASYVNGKIVIRVGMRRLCWLSLSMAVLLAAIFIVPCVYYAGHPPLWQISVFLSASLFCIGIVSGNINAMAMAPLGAIAGIGASVVGSLSTIVASLLGFAIGRTYDGSVVPIVVGFFILNLAAVAVMYVTARQDTTTPV